MDEQQLHDRLTALENAAETCRDVATAALLWARVLTLIRQAEADGDRVAVERCDKLGAALLDFDL